MAYLLLLQNIRNITLGVLDSFMLEITALGETLVTFLLLSAIYWCVDKRIGQLMAWNIAIACWLNQWMKKLWKIDRPWVRDSHVVPVEEAVAGAGGFSMPSGHTTRTVATWGAAGYSAWKKAQRAISIACWITVATVMFSRNYLGVHTPQDVLVALGMGIVVMIVADRLLLWVERGEKAYKDIVVASLGCVAVFLPMLRYGCLSNAGASFGFIIGWLFERRFVRFKISGNWQKRLLRFSIGAATLFLMLTSGKQILIYLVPEKYVEFYLQGAVSFFIIFLYPWLIQCWEERKYYKALLCLIICVLGGCFALAGSKTEQSGESNVVEKTTAIEESPVEALEETKTDNTVKIIASRGYSGVAPENTLDAFSKAVDIGADMIELDVQKTADGELVVFHDSELIRITGVEGVLADWTYEQLQALDAGNGEHIPTLSQVLQLIQPTNLEIYLELKDIGESEDFAVSVAQMVQEIQMQDRVIFASSNYQYLQQIKETDWNNRILYDTRLGDADRLLVECPADYYGLWLEDLTQDTIRKLKEVGKQVYVWKVDTAEQMKNVIRLGADGILTSEPGIARVVVHEEYSWLSENTLRTIMLPVLYENSLQEPYANDYIVQGMTKIGQQLLVSAYDIKGEKNSILYKMDLDGKLIESIDLGFRAHVGGIAYDATHNLLWVTGPEGSVKAISSEAVCAGTYQGTQEEILTDFDAGLTNHNGNKVASFLTIDNGILYVGSYVKGETGKLCQYDIENPMNPILIQEYDIPECIQGITFAYNAEENQRTLILSQGQDIQDAALLVFNWIEGTTQYIDPLEKYILPEGVEQIQMSADGLWILFDSAVRPYRATCRVPNDRIWLVRWK